ncbi:winged helix-turn-helix domain-containing protein [Blastococcus sp. PRF04-17]|uniref:winged helix-turn-helix domain-containing protein n=1 Tax=Blastococcus sp. PRF04-17 TaxID=2933797 RepID=UPI00211171F8|nr:response regulator transcription factor [Blastococcus sp. PRF04-17]
MLRRAAGVADAAQAPVTVGQLTVDPRNRRVTHAGQSVELSPKKFDLLAYLAARAGTLVSKRELLSEVWQLPYGRSDKTVDVHMSWLRRKLGETGAEPKMLQTVCGVAVRLAVPEP